MSDDLFLEPAVHVARDQLPGTMRQRVRKAIWARAETPRPSDRIAVDAEGLELWEGVELRRVRMERWRIVRLSGS